MTVGNVVPIGAETMHLEVLKSNPKVVRRNFGTLKIQILLSSESLEDELKHVIFTGE